MLESGSTKNNNSVVGAKFSSGESKKHIITHCVNQKTIIDSMSNIETVVSIIRNNFGDRITYGNISEINNNKYNHLFRKKGKLEFQKVDL